MELTQTISDLLFVLLIRNLFYNTHPVFQFDIEYHTFQFDLCNGEVSMILRIVSAS